MLNSALECVKTKSVATEKIKRSMLKASFLSFTAKSDPFMMKN